MSTTSRRLLRRTLLGASLCLAAGNASAININDDYLQRHHGGDLHDFYDRDNTFPSVGTFFLFSDVLGEVAQHCTASLIRSNMVLTAAHCVREPEDRITATPGVPGMAMRFSPDPEAVSTPYDRRLADLVVFPDYEADVNRDLAVVRLDRPVRGLVPVRLAGPDDRPAAGTQAVAVGYGAAGTGQHPGGAASRSDHLPGQFDMRRRVAEVQVDAPEDEIATLTAQFRRPDSPDDPNQFEWTMPVPERQGAVDHGDSGGPLFIQTPNGWVQVGVARAIVSPYVHDIPHGGYGYLNFWSFVPSYLDWIAQAIAELSSTQDVSVRSAPGWQAWHVPDSWRGGVPHNVGGSIVDARWVPGRFYAARLDAPASVVIDAAAEVDTLTLSHPQARLHVPAGQSLTAWWSTRLLAGDLQVDGHLESEEIRLSGGWLSGSGEVAAYAGIQQTGGTLAAGSASGAVLAVNGDVVQGAGARTEVSVQGWAAGQHGVLKVVGRYQAHGTLALASAVPVMLGQGLAFASASGGVYGAYTGTVSSGAWTAPGTRWDVWYGADHLKAYLTPASYASLGAAGLADSDNRRRVGEALDAVRPAAGHRQPDGLRAEVFEALMPRTGAQLPRDLDQLGGAAYAAMRSVAVQDSRYLSGQVADVLASQRRGEAFGAAAGREGERRQVWASMGARWAHLDGDVDVRSRRLGWSAGVQYRLDNDWTVGAALGYSQSTLRAASALGDGRLRQGHLSLYAQRAWSSGWFTEWQLDGGAGRLHLSRSVALLGRQHRGASPVRHVGASGRFGWASASADQARWEATAGLRYQQWRLGGFDDSAAASASALRVAGSTQRQLTSQLSVGGSMPWQRGGVAWRAAGWLGWEHTFGQRDQRMDATLLGAGFAQYGRGPGRDRLQAGLSVQADLSNRSRFALRVQGEAARGWRTGQATLDWRYRY